MNVPLGSGKRRECKLFPSCVKAGMWGPLRIKSISNEQSSNPDEKNRSPERLASMSKNT